MEHYPQTSCSTAELDLTKVCHIIYGLHAFSALAGLFSAAFIVTGFLTGWPSIIAVIINYVKRDSVRNTYLDSHFSWQIRTFWWACGWFAAGWGLSATIIGAVVGIPILFATGIWILYRIIRGWLRLGNREPMPMKRPR